LFLRRLLRYRYFSIGVVFRASWLRPMKSESLSQNLKATKISFLVTSQLSGEAKQAQKYEWHHTSCSLRLIALYGRRGQAVGLEMSADVVGEGEVEVTAVASRFFCYG
jgi:hypothetical protein